MALLGTALLGHSLYHYKKDSADGRVFIWELSVQMILSEPLTGYGYGLFERNYGLQQSDYFKSNNGNENERKNATHVCMAYNEYIEQWVDGGMIGMLFYFFVLIYTLREAVRLKKIEAATVTAAIALMGCSNFTIQAIPVWLVFLVYASSLSAKEKKIVLGKKTSFIFSLICILFATTILFNQQKLYNAQRKLKQALILHKENKTQQSIQLLKQQIDNAGTSEAYLRICGNTLMHDKNYNAAIAMLEKASLYTSNPAVYFSLANCYVHTKQYQKAEEALTYVANMIPLNLKSRYQLMQLYEISGQTDKTKEKAREIISISPKVTTKESAFYQKSAKKTLEEAMRK